MTGDPLPVDRKAVWLPILLALAIGVTGGVVFSHFNLPLPWILGPVVCNLVASMLRWPVAAPQTIRPFVQIVIGVMLGSSFSPEILDQLLGWIASIALFAVYLCIVGVLVVPYYRRLGGFDPVTSYFAAMPGGLTDMAFIGRDMGGDDRTIMLAHTSRIVLVVILLAAVSRFLPGFEASPQQGIGVPWHMVPGSELAILAAAGVAGFFMGTTVRLPAPQILGPMIVCAGLSLGGVVSTPPPQEIIILAQILLGTILGCRFMGTPPRMILRALLLGAGATVIMLSLTVFFAVALHGLVGQPPVRILLAYAPGGLAEMSLIALAMGEDASFVAAHHILRISLVLLMAPVVFSLLGWRRRPGRDD